MGRRLALRYRHGVNAVALADRCGVDGTRSRCSSTRSLPHGSSRSHSRIERPRSAETDLAQERPQSLRELAWVLVICVVSTRRGGDVDAEALA